MHVLLFYLNQFSFLNIITWDAETLKQKKAKLPMGHLVNQDQQNQQKKQWWKKNQHK